MIKHLVMWRLKEEAEGRSKNDNALVLKEKLEALPKDIPELKRAEVGINFDTSDAAWDVVLYSEFNSRADLRAYQAHPLHQALIRDFLVKVCADKAVVDYEI